jgi:hypothetical protein
MADNLNLFNQGGLFGPAGGGFGGLLDPRAQAMLGAAQVLSQAGGPSRMPISTGAALSSAMAQGVNSYRQAQAAGMQQQMNQMKFDQAKRAQGAAQTQKLARERYLTALRNGGKDMAGNPVNMNALAAAAAPDAYIGASIEQRFAKPAAAFKNDYMQYVYALGEKVKAGTATPEEVRKYKLSAAFLARPQQRTVNTPTGTETYQVPGFDVAALGYPVHGQEAGSPQPQQTGSPQQTAEQPTMVSSSLSTLAQGKIDMQGAVEQKWEAYKTALREVGPSIIPFTADYKKIQSSYTAVLLALKDAAKLGVLAGPDLDLLHSWLQDPTTVMAQLGRINPKYLMADVENIDATISSNRKRLNQQFGIKQAPDKPSDNVPAGMPAGSKPTGRMFKGQQVWQSPDGKVWVAN